MYTGGDRRRKMGKYKFYLVIITLAIIIGISFAYIQGIISSRNLYNASLGKRKPSMYDFYEALSGLRYWMRKHTEQGVKIEKESRF